MNDLVLIDARVIIMRESFGRFETTTSAMKLLQNRAAYSFPPLRCLDEGAAMEILSRALVRNTGSSPESIPAIWLKIVSAGTRGGSASEVAPKRTR